MHIKALKRPPVLLCEVCHTFAEQGFWREQDEAWVCRGCYTFPVLVPARQGVHLAQLESCESGRLPVGKPVMQPCKRERALNSTDTVPQGTDLAAGNSILTEP